MFSQVVDSAKGELWGLAWCRTVSRGLFIPKEGAWDCPPSRPLQWADAGLLPPMPPVKAHDGEIPENWGSYESALKQGVFKGEAGKFPWEKTELKGVRESAGNREVSRVGDRPGPVLELRVKGCLGRTLCTHWITPEQGKTGVKPDSASSVTTRPLPGAWPDATESVVPLPFFLFSWFCSTLR